MIEEQNWQVLDIGKLVKADWNYKEEDEELTKDMMQSLTNNIKRQGQVENIQVRQLPKGKFEVINGNHRYDAFNKLGKKKIIVYNHGKMSREEAIRTTIETNETKFQADNIKLAKLFKELNETYTLEELGESMPYTVKEIKNLVDLTDFNWDEEKDKVGDLPNQTDAEGFEEIKLALPPEVAAQFRAQIDRFKKHLYPEDKPKDVSIVMPIEAMVQCLAQIPDGQLV